MPLNSTSSSLISGIRNRRGEAWTMFVDLYGPLVYHWARRASLDADTADDVVQEVFRGVLSGIAKFNSSLHVRGGCRAWLRGITQHKIADAQRAQMKAATAVGGSSIQRRIASLADLVPIEEDPDAGPQDDDESPETDRSHQRWLLRRALDLIRADTEPHVWTAFWRSTVDGHSSTEIAESLGMTTGAVRQAKFRVVRRLRDCLGDDLVLEDTGVTRSR